MTQLVEQGDMGTSPYKLGDPKWAMARRDRSSIDMGYRLYLCRSDLEWPPRCQRGNLPSMGTHPPLRRPASGPQRTSLSGADLHRLQGHKPPLGCTLAAQLQLEAYRGWPVGQHYQQYPTTIPTCCFCATIFCR